MWRQFHWALLLLLPHLGDRVRTGLPVGNGNCPDRNTKLLRLPFLYLADLRRVAVGRQVRWCGTASSRLFGRRLRLLLFFLPKHRRGLFRSRFLFLAFGLPGAGAARWRGPTTVGGVLHCGVSGYRTWKRRSAYAGLPRVCNFTMPELCARGETTDGIRQRSLACLWVDLCNLNTTFCLVSACFGSILFGFCTRKAAQWDFVWSIVYWAWRLAL